MKHFYRCTFTHLFMVAALLIAGGVRAEDVVLYRFSRSATFDGAFGPLAKAQHAIVSALAACGTPMPVAANVLFNPATRDAIIALAHCPDVASHLPAGSAAASGALTQALWQVLRLGAPPEAADRARSLLLTFEQTDYSLAEWNFCQNKPSYDPAHDSPICYTNDPKSYLTWGPNGATAGHGREVQNIIALVAKTDSDLIDARFGAEAGAVKRMLSIPEAGRATEIYLCGIWADAARRKAWTAGFQAFGGEPRVRTAFDTLYQSSNYDGGKIDAFYKAYAARGYLPSEVDFAFFTDRAAHSAVPPAAVLAKSIPTGKTNWEARRAVALAIQPTNPSQKPVRLGRDIAFYVDSLTPQNLTAAEQAAWKLTGSHAASDVGLSDLRPAAAFKPGPPLNAGPATGAITEAERAACPVSVLSPRPPVKHPPGG